jgi:aminoglycoside phosphotransferase (APT) family kinase protein
VISSVEDRIHELCAELFPGARVEAVTRLGQEPSGQKGAIDKALGYGAPLRVDLRSPDGALRRVVLHTATANDFGHDRRADRAAEALLAFDTFGLIPDHVRPLDVGAIMDGGHFLSLRHAGEFYVLTTYAEGTIYADDLARVARAGRAAEEDIARATRLASYLASLHATKGQRPAAYTRAVRDLVGSGEGIFGIIDGYPDDVPGAPAPRLQAIERAAVEARHRLRGSRDRLSRTHGDFHPFNIVFDERGGLVLLDTSRGSEGDPADDVTCLSINYLFFSLDVEGAWAGLRELWVRFWATYLEASGDQALLDVTAPFFAWRGLVLANPRWYPSLSAGARDKLLTFVERVFDAGRFDLSIADEVFG